MGAVVNHFIDAGFGNCLASFEGAAIAMRWRGVVRAMRRSTTEADSLRGALSMIPKAGGRTGQALSFHLHTPVAYRKQEHGV